MKLPKNVATRVQQTWCCWVLLLRTWVWKLKRSKQVLHVSSVAKAKKWWIPTSKLSVPVARWLWVLRTKIPVDLKTIKNPVSVASRIFLMTEGSCYFFSIPAFLASIFCFTFVGTSFLASNFCCCLALVGRGFATSVLWKALLVLGSIWGLFALRVRGP